MAAAIELYHDKDGMALPAAVAPFDVVVTPVNYSDAAQRSAAEEVYQRCLKLGAGVGKVATKVKRDSQNGVC